jgi:type I restriction enzyme S subunit
LANKCTGKSESQKDVSDKALGMLPFPKLDDNQIKRVASAIRDTIGKSHELEAQENEYRDKADDLLRKAKSNIFNLLDDSWFNDLVSEAKEALQ